MSWIYTAVRKPTEADGNENGLVLVRLADESVGARQWPFVNVNNQFVAWMPIPPYTPLPPVPDGYRLMTDYSETPDNRAMRLDRKSWIARSCFGKYDTEQIYCVPIEPPWIPAIVTAGVLKPGTWVCIDPNGSWYHQHTKPEFSIGQCWSASRRLPVAEQPQITGEHAIWQVPQ